MAAAAGPEEEGDAAEEPPEPPVRCNPYYSVARQRARQQVKVAQACSEPSARVRRLVRALDAAASVGLPDGVLDTLQEELVGAETVTQSPRAARFQAPTSEVLRAVTPVRLRGGPFGTENLERLQERYALQGYVEGAENRGISLSQLRQVAQYLAEQCNKWNDTASAQFSKTAGKTLNMQVLNLYHVSTWVIRPATKAHKCAFVELLVDRPQAPAWFVSHWWGEIVANFIKCIEAHTATRCLSEDTFFWVCAYANRQHSLDAEIGNGDPKASSFFKAMELAEFKVLMILDQKTELGGPATPFLRVWCAFEASMCLDQVGTPPLDLATYSESGPVFLTKSLTQKEEAMELEKPGCGIGAKSAREKQFPLDIMEFGLKFKLQKAEASVPADKARILNSIAKRDLDLKPLPEHERYDQINKRLHSLFALAFFRRAMDVEAAEGDGEGDNDASGPQLRVQAKLAKALRNDEWRLFLSMDLAGCVGVCDKHMQLLNYCLPPGLRELNLNLSNTKIGDAGLKKLARGLPADLQAASVDLTNCEAITVRGVEAVRRMLPESMQALQLALKGTQVSQDVQDACLSLEGLRQCEALGPREGEEEEEGAEEEEEMDIEGLAAGGDADDDEEVEE